MLKITKHQPRSVPDQPSEEKRSGLARKIVGGFFLFTGGVHLGIVMADPQLYAPFARESFIPLIEKAWDSIFMAAPARWGLALSLGETAFGVLLLRGGQWAKAGWIGVIAFHMGLMLFGWGFWLWSIPALAFLIWAARKDWPSLGD
ncbi:hypothetical protein [Arthrobacter pityocampae]|uniref:hypothetical protein n=1 Tax=Arthrobacter pityocampae TaxID=547334 RepID=UPI003736D0B9